MTISRIVTCPLGVGSWLCASLIAMNQCPMYPLEVGHIFTAKPSHFYGQTVRACNLYRLQWLQPLVSTHDSRALGSPPPMSSRHRNLEPLGRWHATISNELPCVTSVTKHWKSYWVFGLSILATYYKRKKGPRKNRQVKKLHCVFFFIQTPGESSYKLQLAICIVYIQ